MEEAFHTLIEPRLTCKKGGGGVVGVILCKTEFLLEAKNYGRGLIEIVFEFLGYLVIRFSGKVYLICNVHIVSIMCMLLLSHFV